MLQLHQIQKSFGNRILYSDLNINLSKGEKLGLLGRNGHGKSVLLKIISQELSPDSGQIIIPKNYSIGYLQQHLNFSKQNIVEELMENLPKDSGENHDAMDYKAKEILSGLGFSTQDFDKAALDFSGGYQIRIQLGKVLISKPNLLLLDEPSNFLDILAKRWFVQYLRSWEDEMIIVSHEREFLDSLITHSAFIGPGGKIYHLPGNTEKLFERMEQDLIIQEKTFSNQEKKIKQTQEFIDRFRSKASKASVVQSRIKSLEKLDKIQLDEKISTLDFSFNYAPIEAKSLIKINDLKFGYDISKILFSQLTMEVKANSIIGIIGQNGKGKSTLLKILAKELNPLDGNISMHPNASISYFGQTNIDRLNGQNTIYEEIESANGELNRTQVQNIAGTMMFTGDDAQKKIKVLSGGEKSRVMLGKILATTCNILLLDEPTNHLDMESIESLKSALKDFKGSTLIVTHHEGLLQELCSQLIVFDGEKAFFFNGNYADFLEKIGWDKEVKKQEKEKKSWVVEKKLRQELVMQRSMRLKEPKKELSLIESKLELLEKNKKQLEEKINNSNVNNMSELLKNLNATTKELDEWNEKYLVVMEKIYEIEEEINVSTN